MTLTVATGIAATGADVVFGLYKGQQLRTVASAAAISGAVSPMTGGDYRREARAVTATAGFGDHLNGAVIAVNNPLRGGGNMVTTAVEAIVSQARTFPLVGLVRTGRWDIGAWTVATAGVGANGGMRGKPVEEDGVDGP